MKDKVANPAPLGLLGFGMTTVLLGLANAGLYPSTGVDSMILAMGLAYGGLAQIIAGIMEYRNGNTFGTTAFCSYGLFWWSLVALLVLPGLLDVQAYTAVSLAAYFCMWGLFTGAMFFSTLKASRALQLVFLTLTALFFLLTARELTSNTTIGIVAGYEGVVCGFTAFYLAVAEVINEAHERPVLPTG